MSDLPRNDGGWRVLPQDYLARRPPTYSSLRRPTSFYAAMRDGVRLAVDVYLPSDSDGSALAERLPAIVIFTPYYRRFALRSDAPPSSEPSISASRYRDFFVPRGGRSVRSNVTFRSRAARSATRPVWRAPPHRSSAMRAPRENAAAEASTSSRTAQPKQIHWRWCALRGAASAPAS